MNADEYQKLAMRTAATPDLFNNNVDGSMDDVLHALLGIGTEAGELQDMLKKHLMYGKAFDRTNLVEECGDLLWYIALALKTVNVTMSDCMERNIKKLQVRYPQKFTTENALNRNLEQEARALTAPADERVAVLRHRDGWHVYSDGSDDMPGSPASPGCWGIAPCKVGDKRWYIGQSKIDETGPYAALIDWPPRPVDERVAEATRTPEPPAPEPEVPAEVRPWLDALREVWPEMRASPLPIGTWAVSRDSFAEDKCDAFASAGDPDKWLLGASHEKELVYYSTPAALVAALKKALGEETR